MASRTDSALALPTLAAQQWQMSFGERAAFEGLLSQAAPKLAVEIGTAEGGSLRRIAAHSAEVHSFDLVAPPEDVAELENVTFHTGDSHELLGTFLRQAEADQRSIDFVLIDGDHSAEGVRRDIVDVLGSEAVTNAVVVLHDTLNPEVRGGIEAARVADNPKVAVFEVDLVPGYLARHEPYRLTMWGGLGLIVVDASRSTSPSAIRDDRFHELFRVLRPTVEVMAALEARGDVLDGLDGDEVERALRDELSRLTVQETGAETSAALAESLAESERLAARLEAIEGSRGWRIVVALREIRQLLRPAR